MTSPTPNYLLLTYDSCRYDVMVDAKTPVLKSYSEILCAQAPGSFTYSAHQAMFVGLFPNVVANRPFYNRFCKQLLGLAEVGETQVVKDAALRVNSDTNLIQGLCDIGFQTVGAAAMSWFKQKTLQTGFQKFLFAGTDARKQIDYLLANIDEKYPFFGFINFGETHAPYHYSGKPNRCPVDVRARRIEWPPVERGGVGKDNLAYRHQMESAEFLDRRLPKLFSSLPANTVVILCGDHGECFGENGYWGHGFNHPKVLEVPLSIFRLDGLEL